MSEAPLISIVDDDALARDGIGELIESLGYKAVTFVSADHFLESGLIAETTCLITDLQMPGLNGLELQEAAVAGIPDAGNSDYRLSERETSEACARQRSGRLPEQAVR
jgi:CheY-like chemotaxis protein